MKKTESSLEIKRDLVRVVPRKKSTLATFVDVRKAYDNVWPARLFFKLKSIGLSENNVLLLLQSFLVQSVNSN